MTPSHPLTWLALGDSYTIGEGLPLYESYPYQALQLLRQPGLAFSAPEIIARTGWTTGELQEAVDRSLLMIPYDIVTLLIGVNNQYRKLSPDDYARDFKPLLQQALTFAGGRKERVFVLSIPDWGVTPFATHGGYLSAQISAEIERFNQINEAISADYGVSRINITPGTLAAATDSGLLAADQLHYSGKEYARWAELLAQAIREALPV
jgi:lysophospholipase L1-like esterase